MKIYVITEDEIDYDFEDDPYLLNVKLVRAYFSLDVAQANKLDHQEIKEVELQGCKWHLMKLKMKFFDEDYEWNLTGWDQIAT